jgi:hypothetical protein
MRQWWRDIYGRIRLSLNDATYHSRVIGLSMVKSLTLAEDIPWGHFRFSIDKLLKLKLLNLVVLSLDFPLGKKMSWIIFITLSWQLLRAKDLLGWRYFLFALIISQAYQSFSGILLERRNVSLYHGLMHWEAFGMMKRTLGLLPGDLFSRKTLTLTILEEQFLNQGWLGWGITLPHSFILRRALIRKDSILRLQG